MYPTFFFLQLSVNILCFNIIPQNYPIDMTLHHIFDIDAFVGLCFSFFFFCISVSVYFEFFFCITLCIIERSEIKTSRRWDQVFVFFFANIVFGALLFLCFENPFNMLFLTDIGMPEIVACSHDYDVTYSHDYDDFFISYLFSAFFYYLCLCYFFFLKAFLFIRLEIVKKKKSEILFVLTLYGIFLASIIVACICSGLFAHFLYIIYIKPF